MRWLFASQLRPYVWLAAGASLVLNLVLVMPAVYMMQVFDRVFASRSLETLGMLSALVALALALGYAMDVVRSRALAWAGSLVDRQLSPAALRASLERASLPGRTRDAEALRDISALRSFLAGSAILALFDAPWVPVYLIAITLMHPLLGVVSAAGAVLLFALTLATDTLTRRAAESAQQHSRAVQRHTQSLIRHAEAIAGMGMASAAVRGWSERHEALISSRSRLGERSARLAALARISRQALQAALLGIGAWLVIGEHASPGIMVAATIMFGRALQPVEQLIAGWKTLVEARAAWRRLEEPGSAQVMRDTLALPAPQGRIDVERVVFSPAAQRAPLIKGVSFSLEAGESMG
ncbi:MAG: type I secretion system permease/ATPase, partial [Betaproteobacteria bacterium]